MRRTVSWCQRLPPFGVGALLASRVAAIAEYGWPALRSRTMRRTTAGGVIRSRPYRAPVALPCAIASAVRTQIISLERTVRGMGDGSTLDVYPTPSGRIGGLIRWENYMPLARFFLYSQGVDVWVAPTLARGDGWVATMRRIAREGRCYVIGVNPCVRVDQIPADFPDRERVWQTVPQDPDWVEPGNTVIVGTNGEILAGPARYAETVLDAELDFTKVLSARRLFDPVGHYHRPDVFRLAVDAASRPVVTTLRNGHADD